MTRPPVLVIPAYNEEAHLGDVLAQIAAGGLDYQVVVIDDGSHDRTAAVAAAGGARVVRHPFNLGYGAALQTGYKYAVERQAPWLVQMDADGQHDPGEIPRLDAPIRSGECDLAVGSRFLEPTAYEMGWVRSIGRELFRGLACLSGLHLTDPTSGFQAMNRRVMDVYTTDFYPSDYPDVDVLLTAHRSGLRVREVAVHMSAGLRASSMHGGIRSFYYVYKMLLSIWAASAVRELRP